MVLQQVYRRSLQNTSFDNLIAVALRTGMRREELLGLTWNCVNWSKPSITIRQALIRTSKKGYEIKRPKNSKKREIEITPDVVEALRSKQRKQEALKARLKGKGINDDGSTFDLYDDKNLVFARQDGFYSYPDTVSHWLPAICKKNWHDLV